MPSFYYMDEMRLIVLRRRIEIVAFATPADFVSFMCDNRGTGNKWAVNKGGWWGHHVMAF